MLLGGHVYMYVHACRLRNKHDKQICYSMQVGEDLSMIHNYETQ